MSAKLMLVLIFLLCFIKGIAQDTFYVKKKKSAPVVAKKRPAWDSTNHDSIVSYTLEYQKPNSTIWVKLHQQGPFLQVPNEVYGSGRRVLFTEIIAIDENGQRYRQPDRYWQNGIYVPVKSP